MALKYIGRGEFLPGVPARDLSDEEVERAGGEEFLLARGLYARVRADAPSQSAAKPKSARVAIADKAED